MYLVDYHTHPYVHGDIIDYNEKHLVKFIDTAIKRESVKLALLIMMSLVMKLIGS